jgi:O-acetyl-ADP-ribose deacetylase (regulator of RNase III)
MDITINKTRLSLKQGDITLQDTDAIVNAANSGLMGGGGVDGAIHRAGGPAILEDCKRIVANRGRLPAGQAVITTGGNKGLKSLSFPSISTGVYSYPVEEAAHVALSTVIEFLQQDTSLEEVVFVLFDSRTLGAYEQALGELQSV